MLRFLHGYIPEMWPGLVRRGLIDDTSGIKFHQVMDTPDPLRFNHLAKEGGELYGIIRECNRPFYLDRLQGGWWFYEYDFDMRLLNAYREQLEAAGLVISGVSPDSSLVEFVELPREEHPFYVATQAHPEFKSRPTRAHPLFAGLVGAALAARNPA